MVPTVESIKEEDTRNVCNIDEFAARVLAHEECYAAHGEELQIGQETNGNFTFPTIYNEGRDPKLWLQRLKGTMENKEPNLYKDELLLK